jgi:hypothetical protein
MGGCVYAMSRTGCSVLVNEDRVMV